MKGTNNMNIHNESELLEAAGILYLSPDNCSFSKNGDFLSVTVECDNKKSTYPKVSLHRLFPYDRRDEFISVLDEDKVEIGIIEKLDVFDADTLALLSSELKRKYYICRLNSVLSINDRFGYTYWKAQSDDGEVSFTVRDAHNNIRTGSDGRITINDIDKNRYELAPFDTLDAKTRRRIELYV